MKKIQNRTKTPKTKFLFQEKLNENSEAQEQLKTESEKIENTVDSTQNKVENIIGKENLSTPETEEQKKVQKQRKEGLDDEGMTDHKNINIVETGKDQTMYAPTRVAAKVLSAVPYAIIKGVFWSSPTSTRKHILSG
jgi:predicted nuclease with TOPRIM domain